MLFAIEIFAYAQIGTAMEFSNRNPFKNYFVHEKLGIKFHLLYAHLSTTK